MGKEHRLIPRPPVTLLLCLAFLFLDTQPESSHSIPPETTEQSTTEPTREPILQVPYEYKPFPLDRLDPGLDIILTPDQIVRCGISNQTLFCYGHFPYSNSIWYIAHPDGRIFKPSGIQFQISDDTLPPEAGATNLTAWMGVDNDLNAYLLVDLPSSDQLLHVFLGEITWLPAQAIT